MNDAKAQCRICGDYLSADYRLIGLCARHVDITDDLVEEYSIEVDQESLSQYVEEGCDVR